MKDRLEKVLTKANEEISKVSVEVDLNNLKAKFLGRKGIITEVLKGMKDLSEEERPVMGKLINETKDSLENMFDKKFKEIHDKKKQEIIEKEKIDVTLPGRGRGFGAKHPITQVMEEIITIFQRMGFQVAEGPEVEHDYYNFEALNIPKNHL